jgi:hypothetical protein
VDALKHYKHAFNPEELVTVEEKIHGSNARFVYKDEHMYCSSRTQWKSDKANCIWRNVLKTEPWINDWCLAHEGYCLYAEICPTQGEKFQYGNAGPHIFVFDVRSPEGKWLTREEIGPLDLKEHWVPVLWQGLFKDIPWTIVDGQTTVPNAKGIREGVVIRPVNERHVHGLGRLILKEVSKAYLEKETKGEFMYPSAKEAILAFVRERLANATPEGAAFTADQLRNFVMNNVAGGVSPSSADRVLRTLRQAGRLDYVVLNRSKSLYKAVPLGTTQAISDATGFGG